MVALHFIWLYLWVAPHVLLAAVVVIMLRRKRQKDFPVFFSYLLYEILQFCVLFAMSRFLSVSAKTYLQIDLFGRAGSIAFRFAIIQELLEAPVAHNASLRKLVARMLMCTTAVLAVVAALFIGSVYSWNFHELIVPAYAINETLNIIQCGLLAFVFLWHRFLHLRMPNFVVGIALGMGLVAGLEPLMHALRGSLMSDSRIVDFVEMGVYHISVLVWFYFARTREQFSQESAVTSVLDAREWALEAGRFTWR